MVRSGEGRAVAGPWSLRSAWRCLQSVHVKDYSPENLRELVHIVYEQLFVGNPEGIVPGCWPGTAIRSMPWRPPGTGSCGTCAVGRPPSDWPHVLTSTSCTAGWWPRTVRRSCCARDGRARANRRSPRMYWSLAGHGWPIAVVRMDRADPSVRTARGLGTMMNLQDSPGILLPGVADGGPGLFVVDQLDAVSLYSGRMADVFEAVEDVLAQLSAAPNIKVLLVVRTVDVEQDGRLSRLMTADVRAERFPVGELTEDSVRAVLTASGNDPDKMPSCSLPSTPPCAPCRPPNRPPRLTP